MKTIAEIKKEECLETNFQLLNIPHAKEKFNLKSIRVYGDIMFVCSQRDEWYLRYEQSLERVCLYHRNTRGEISCFHREKKKFRGVIQILSYISLHDKKGYLIEVNNRYQRKNLDSIFEKIEQDRKTKRKHKCY